MRGDGCVSEFGLLSTYFLIYRPRSGPGEAEDQTGTRCGYLAVTPAGTVTGYTARPTCTDTVTVHQTLLTQDWLQFPS